MTVLADLIQMRAQIDKLLVQYRDKRGVLVVDDRLVHTLQHVVEACHPSVRVVFASHTDVGCKKLVDAVHGRSLNFFGWMFHHEHFMDVVHMANAVEAVKFSAAKMPAHIDVISKQTKRVLDIARVLSAASAMKVVSQHEGCETFFKCDARALLRHDEDDVQPHTLGPGEAWEALNRMCEWVDGATDHDPAHYDAYTVAKALKAYGNRWQHAPCVAVLALGLASQCHNNRPRVDGTRSVPLGTALRLLELDLAGKQLKLTARSREELNALVSGCDFEL
jgi:hypothetical protein